jgi:hypothetical protein
MSEFSTCVIHPRGHLSQQPAAIDREFEIIISDPPQIAAKSACMQPPSQASKPAKKSAKTSRGKSTS